MASGDIEHLSSESVRTPNGLPSGLSACDRWKRLAAKANQTMETASEMASGTRTVIGSSQNGSLSSYLVLTWCLQLTFQACNLFAAETNFSVLFLFLLKDTDRL